ncbi:MAG: cytochrome P450 [Acidimicrobiia bacterium]|nr:cytochrome P450 [Acidimicrobiia bacterium]
MDLRWRVPVGFDLNDPAVIADPYPTYARLRAEAPVAYLPDIRFWVLSRYDDVLAALRDAETFSSDLRGLADDMRVNPFNPAMRIPRRLAALGGRLPWARVLLASDPPEHTVLRRKISKAFTPRMIAEWEPRIRQITEALVDDLRDQARSGPVDLVRCIGSPLPTTVIAEMLGVPAERREDFKRWSDDLVGGLVSGGSIRRMLRSGAEIIVFFAGVVRKRRSAPGDDLISLLVTGDEENRLGVPELVTFCILLLVAGNETTTNLVANAMLALFDRSDVADRLRADPTLAASVIEETLRYDNPGQGLIRLTTTEVTNGEAVIPEGSKVLTLIGSANRDPSHFDAPNEFRLDRDPNDHLGFGNGIHHCIGAPLARLEGRIALETLFSRTRAVTPAGTPHRIKSAVLRGLHTLPVKVDV